MLQDYPPCFKNKEQYAEWKFYAVRSHLKSMFICIDCTPEYQAEMIKVNRCQDPDVNIKLLQQREMEESMHQEIL
jgi:hypothetical protein